MRERKISGTTMGMLTLLSFLIPCAALTMIFYFAQVYPFGDSSLLFSGNAEWFETTARTHAALLGQKDIFYSFEQSLGSDFYSRFASGGFSPFLLITVFFKQSALREALSVIMCLKAGCAGLFSFLLLSRLTKQQPMLALPFAAAYGSGSLFALGFLAPQLTDCAVFLPLIGAGTAMLVDRGSLIALYVGLVLFLASCGTMWPCALILPIIMLIWLRQTRERNRATLLSQTALLLLCDALAIGSSMVLTIPALSASMQASTAVTPPSKLDAATLPALLSGLFPGSGTAEGQAALVCTSALTVVMLPIYYLNKSYKTKERMLSLFTSLAVLLSMVIPVLGWIMLGFSRPTGTMVATSACCSLLFVAAAVRAVVRCDRLRVGTVIAAWLCALGVYLCAVIFGFGKSFSIESIIFTIVFMTLYAAIILITVSKRSISAGFCTVLTACILCEAVFGGTLSIISAKKSLPMESYSAQAESELLEEIALNSIEANENGAKGFFRVRAEKACGLNSIGAHSDSATKQSRLLLDVMGIKGDNGFTRFTQALFGVKYYIGQAEAGSNAVPVGSDGTNTVFYNPEALPLCFAASDDILELTEFSSDPFEAQNQLITALCGAAREIFCETGYVSSGSGVAFVDTLEGVELTRSAEQGSVSFAVTVPCDGTLYMYMKCDTGCEETVSVNGVPLLSRRLDSIISLGNFVRGDTVYVDVTVHSERAMLEALSFSVLDESLFSASLSQLASASAQYITVDGGSVTATAAIAQDQVLMTTVPWQQGWSCRLDRQDEFDISCGAGSLIALELPVGTHNFELSYKPTDFSACVAVSAIMILLGTALVIAAQFRRRGTRLPDGTFVPNAELTDDFAEAANVFPAREVDYSAQFEFDSFEQRRNQFADPVPPAPVSAAQEPDYDYGYGVMPVMPVYAQPMYPVEMPYQGYEADDMPPYDDFAQMAKDRGYDPADQGYYQEPDDLPPAAVPQPKLTIPEKEQYPSPPEKRRG